MGMFDFIKSAGKSLGFGKEQAPTADALKKELESHGLGADKVNLEVLGDKAVIRGDVSSQEILEKVIVAVGNTQGISAVETDVKVPDAREPVFHTVKKGENLWKIAEKHYGNGVKHAVIFEANRPMLTHPDKIYPGQVLRIPVQD
jgi:nucleoid-associated protein YgaU